MHVTVMLHETVDGLNMRDGGIIVDGTLGAGGHSEEICYRSLKQEIKDITLVGIDADKEALARSKERLAIHDHVTQHFVESNTVRVGEILDELGITKIDGFMMDLGVSSFQIGKSGRGFSFRFEEPLAMTFNQNPGENDLTAYDIVNHFSEENLADIIYGFGGERRARRIAAAIVEARQIRYIKTTDQLVKVIESVAPRGRSKIHPATQTFQALRITVNKEIENLPTILENVWQRLNPGGRISMISFHSLEDKIVKNFFRDKAKAGEGTLMTKKPMIATDEEVSKNARSRSAKLRVIEKI
jgi:16S rRNA (cytosine1402-N4)-methyltransferase